VLLAVMALLAAAPAWGQGTVNFRTRVSGVVDAPVYNIDGTTRLAGSAFQAQLFAGPPGAAEAALQSVGVPVPFLTATSAGYVTGSTVTVTGIAAGAQAAIQMRVWEAACGATFEQALAAGSKTGRSVILTLSLGGAGAHVLRWRCLKDSSASDSQDQGGVDQVRGTAPVSPPRILVNDANFGIRTNGFGFNVTGSAGQDVIVEGWANVLIWQSLQTNMLGIGPLYFSAPSTSLFLSRF